MQDLNLLESSGNDQRSVKDEILSPELIAVLKEVFRHFYVLVGTFRAELPENIAAEFDSAVRSSAEYSYSFEGASRFYYEVRFSPSPENEGEYFAIYISNDPQGEKVFAKGFSNNENLIVREKLAMRVS